MHTFRMVLKPYTFPISKSYPMKIYSQIALIIRVVLIKSLFIRDQNLQHFFLGKNNNVLKDFGTLKTGIIL